MNPTLFPVTFSDGTSNQVSVFAGGKSGSPLVLLFPALGVRASFYRHYAAQLASQGFLVATADHRGHGFSSVRASASQNFGYREQVEIEYPGIVQRLKNHFPHSPLVFMGHSIGAQMGALFVARYPHLVSGFIINAGCSVYYKGWGPWAGPAVLAFAFLSKWAAQTLGYYPGNILRFGGKEGKGVILDWFETARKGVFQAGGESFDYDAAMKKVQVPVLGLSYQGDRSAPALALKNLLNKFSAAPAKHLHITQPKNRPCDHYSWVREPELALLPVAEWVRQVCGLNE